MARTYRFQPVEKKDKKQSYKRERMSKRELLEMRKDEY